MMKFKTMIAAVALLIAPLTGSALADNKDTVQAFYDFLSTPASDAKSEALKAAVDEKWESIGDFSGKNKSRDAFMGQVGGFGKLIPDLKWTVEEMIESGDRVIVRSRATGTPAGPLFGVDGKGKAFEIMTIDIHTLENGKIIRSHHIEDWAGALRQLKSK